MSDEEIIKKLLEGETVAIVDKVQFARVRNTLRKYKKNITIVLSQMKND